MNKRKPHKPEQLALDSGQMDELRDELNRFKAANYKAKGRLSYLAHLIRSRTGTPDEWLREVNITITNLETK